MRVAGSTAFVRGRTAVRAERSTDSTEHSTHLYNTAGQHSTMRHIAPVLSLCSTLPLPLCLGVAGPTWAASSMMAVVQPTVRSIEAAAAEFNVVQITWTQRKLTLTRLPSASSHMRNRHERPALRAHVGLVEEGCLQQRRHLSHRLPLLLLQPHVVHPVRLLGLGVPTPARCAAWCKNMVCNGSGASAPREAACFC